jgi:hypothetical protein
MLFPFSDFIFLCFFFFYSGYSLLRDPHHNKGLAFTDKERAAHYLRGLLPPAVVSQELQVLFFHSVSFPPILLAFMLGFVLYEMQLTFSPLYLLGEETDAYYSPISSSITEVHGYDGSSGSHTVPSDSWALDFVFRIMIQHSEVSLCYFIVSNQLMLLQNILD